MKRRTLLTLICFLSIAIDSTNFVISLYCKAGEGVPSGKIFTSGLASQCSGVSKITTEAECEAAAEYNSKNNIDKNGGFGGRWSGSKPPGCYNSGGYKYYWNDDTKSTRKCSNERKCICKPKKCSKCPINTYSKRGWEPTCTPCPTETPYTYDPLLDQTSKESCAICPKNNFIKKTTNKKDECIPCPRGEITDTKQKKCIDPSKLFTAIKAQLEEQKEDTNDLSIKNSRLWQSKEIRKRHDELLAKHKKKDNQKEKDFCKNEQKEGTVIFPAIEISNEIEKNQDTTCIDTNRDELLKAFCSFRMDLDNLFQIQSIDKEAKTFWPNICCKERNDDDNDETLKTLEKCKDPSGKLNRGDIIPFALSQGGNYNRHNLYVEVTEAIKRNGYIHRGMLQLLKSLRFSQTNRKIRNAKKLVNAFFHDVSLCGPRIVEEPGRKDKKKLCELFIPYEHSMTRFYNLIEDLYATPIRVQESSFLEKMENLLVKRQLSSKKNYRLGKKRSMTQQVVVPPFATAMQSKGKTNGGEAKKATCSGGTKPTELLEKQDTFCKGSNRVDLSNTNVKNIALYYLKDEISTKYEKHMVSLKQFIRYDVVDKSCPSKLFDAKDISIQQVAMDTNGIKGKKEWVAVVNLNTKSDDGYLQSELPYCKAKKYLIGANVQVKAYVDNNNCCKDYRDYNMCKKYNGCEDTLEKVFDVHKRQFSRDVTLTGSQYYVDDTHRHHYQKRRRRRRLFTSTGSPNGNRGSS